MALENIYPGSRLAVDANTREIMAKVSGAVTVTSGNIIATVNDPTNAPLGTGRADWAMLRMNVTAADTALDNTSKGAAARGYTVNISDTRINGIQIMAAGVGTEGGSAPIKLYARKGNGPQVLVATLTATLGAIAANPEPITGGTAITNQKYCDGLTITKNGPFKVESGDQTSDQVAVVYFDAGGFTELCAEVGALTNLTRLDLYWSWF